ncbi:hypothetical protein EVAR_83667_1 [Eumeta japonica]|uniref:Uncharacterized protein n=1 Tax=Eumeta variegata TaxID=151549 RepID=A0A4C1UPY9_EUMVA|nr:hypothetical protein EVAR_83667_1 [Eumeta japonica]
MDVAVLKKYPALRLCIGDWLVLGSGASASIGRIKKKVKVLVSSDPPVPGRSLLRRCTIQVESYQRGHGEKVRSLLGRGADQLAHRDTGRRGQREARHRAHGHAVTYGPDRTPRSGCGRARNRRCAGGVGRSPRFDSPKPSGMVDDDDAAATNDVLKARAGLAPRACGRAPSRRPAFP